MRNRREFLKASALGAAASLLPNDVLLGATSSLCVWIPSSVPTLNNSSRQTSTNEKLKKAVLITMLPKQMSYLDRFKLAVDVGFEGIEAQTVVDPKEADLIKEASEKAKIR